MDKTEERSISICTVSMNRLYHLRETLPRNIDDNAGYKRLQLVLLDYNSNDQLEDWVRTHLHNHLDSGRLVYYKYPHAKAFDMAHSKNMAIKLADNEIICLVDADNYTGPGYAKYVNSVFNKNQESFITSIAKGKSINPVDVLGRVALRKSDFMAIEGFDEYMSNYGHDDFDLCSRLELLGRKRVVLRDSKYLMAITHTDEERTSNHKLASNLAHLYISHVSYCRTKVLCLFKDNTYKHGTIVDNRYTRSQSVSTAFRGAITREFSLENSWESGAWMAVDNAITINPDNESDKFNDAHSRRKINLDNYFLINDEEMKNRFIIIVSALINKEKLLGNKKSKAASVNGGVFGEGEVFRNFSNEPIFV